MSSAIQTSNRKFYLLVAAFLLCAVLTGVITASRSGPTELERLKTELRAKGEKLTLAELLSGAGQTNHPPFRTNDLARLAKTLTAQSKQVENLEVMHHLGYGLAEPVWARTNLLTSASRSSPGSTVEWSALEADLAAMETVLAEAEALASVPDVHAGMRYGFPLDWPEYRRHKVIIARWLAVAHAMHIRSGNYSKASAALEATIHLGDWHREELSLIDQRLRVGLLTTALRLTWSTTQSRRVSEAQLAALLNHWKGAVIFTNLSRALEFERARGLNAFANVHANGINSIYGPTGNQREPLARFTRNSDELFFLLEFQSVLTQVRLAESAKSCAIANRELVASDVERERSIRGWSGLRYSVSSLLFV
ncbi:MAG: hypothetical protein WCS99_11990, partial [Limisphaerales bacterium]